MMLVSFYREGERIRGVQKYVLVNGTLPPPVTLQMAFNYAKYFLIAITCLLFILEKIVLHTHYNTV